MHLLVPGAYRHLSPCSRMMLRLGSQCTFWCRVLTDQNGHFAFTPHSESQCTFWCRVLTDCGLDALREALRGLNAPSGAGCLPTLRIKRRSSGRTGSLNAPSGAGCLPTDSDVNDGATLASSQCTFWCRVLTDIFGGTVCRILPRLNAPSGAGCLPTIRTRPPVHRCKVSMHLLVPGAYRPPCCSWRCSSFWSLNAPSGAGCLPTGIEPPTIPAPAVSMHLLVPGAYRRKTIVACGHGRRARSQCTFWCRVLTDGELRCDGFGLVESQCTFWCRVLTDRTWVLMEPVVWSVSMHLLVPGAYRHEAGNVGVSHVASSQCTFWCRVLTDREQRAAIRDLAKASQCTFWCRVLTDIGYSFPLALP